MSKLNKDEPFDIVDENDEIIGQRTRNICHTDPNIIHRVVHLLILNEKGEILVHQRSLKKEYGAGEWQLMSGGHVSAGEDRQTGAQRELVEETGLKVKCFEVGKYLFKYEKETELASLHVCLADCEPVPNEEVEEFRFIKITEIKDLPGFEDFKYPDFENNWYSDWFKLIVKKRREIEDLLGIKFAM